MYPQIERYRFAHNWEDDLAQLRAPSDAMLAAWGALIVSPVYLALHDDGRRDRRGYPRCIYDIIKSAEGNAFMLAAEAHRIGCMNFALAELVLKAKGWS